MRNNFKTLLLIFCIGMCFCLHLARAYEDAKDVNWISQSEIHETFKKDPKYEKLRVQILNRPLFLETDGYYWVLYATEMVREGKWRIRKNMHDNVPYGREVAWHSGYVWFLIGLGQIDSLLTGRNLIDGIEHAAAWSNPILIILFTFFWTLVITKKINLFTGAVFPYLILFLWAIYSDAGYGRVDHHTLHTMLFLSQILSIILGGSGFINDSSNKKKINHCRSLQEPTYTNARKWFVCAGLFGALGIWVGATQQAVLIGFIGIGGAVILIVFSGTATKKNDQGLLAPELWRWWGFSGSALSILFYLIEYFPGNMSMRLEVNHPLYAIAWASGAEAIFRIGLLRQEKLPSKVKKTHYKILILSLLGVLILPMFILLGPHDWHTVHDLFMRRVHDHIEEFISPLYKEGIEGLRWIIINFSLLPFAFFVAAILLFSGFTSKYYRILIIQGLIPSLALLGFCCWQTRWNGLLAASLVALTLILTSVITTRFSEKKLSCISISLVLFILLIPGNYIYIKLCYLGSRWNRVNVRLNTRIIIPILAREIATNFFLARSDEQQVHFISTDSFFTPYLAYFGVGQGVASLYWPNREGIKDYARFFSDLGEQDAITIAKQRGLTHLIFNLSPSTPIIPAWIMHGSIEKNIIEKTLAYRLAKNPTLPPDWLEPFPMVCAPRCQQFGYVLYQIKLKMLQGEELSN